MVWGKGHSRGKGRCFEKNWVGSWDRHQPPGVLYGKE